MRASEPEAFCVLVHDLKAEGRCALVIYQAKSKKADTPPR